MTLQEVCLDAEARIRRIQEILIDLQPESLDRCESELRDVIELLQALLSEEIPVPNEPNRAAVSQLRRTVARLGTQVSLSANLFQGWAQLLLGTGYTAQGKPALAVDSPKASFEI